MLVIIVSEQSIAILSATRGHHRARNTRCVGAYTERAWSVRVRESRTLSVYEGFRRVVRAEALSIHFPIWPLQKATDSFTSASVKSASSALPFTVSLSPTQKAGIEADKAPEQHKRRAWFDFSSITSLLLPHGLYGFYFVDLSTTCTLIYYNLLDSMHVILHRV